MRILYVVVPLFLLLGITIWFAGATWVHLGGSDVPPIPLWGWVAIVGGVLFSLAVGFGLMGLMFYSSRHGYDESGNDPRP
jgi:hypothetical protein